MMNTIDFKLPPSDIDLVLDGESLSKFLQPLVGTTFVLTNKPRTDGSALRKLISNHLSKTITLEGAGPKDYYIVPYKKKGVPKMLLELLDTYIVTTGTVYNLQVWNRIPASNSSLVNYQNGDKIRCSDIRLALVKVEDNTISSITVVTPTYIEKEFGKFGKPTVKHQLTMTDRQRKAVIESESHILLGKDTANMLCKVSDSAIKNKEKMTSKPVIGELLSMRRLNELVAEKLIGQNLSASDTKTRGQSLEKKVIELLGYTDDNLEVLAGGYPDVPNQLLEVKVQDSPTIDLGKYSPELEDEFMVGEDYTTKDVRYLIALTNPKTGTIEGVVLMAGEQLGEYFSYIANVSYKCQRSIPMTFFERNRGKSVFNP